MSEASVNAEIVDILEEVEGIGVVHAYERTSRSPAKYLELMRDTDGVVNGWTVRRRATTSTRYDSNTIIRRAHRFEINGIYGPVDDDAASESTFQALIEAIYTAFKSDYTVGGTCENSGQLQVEDVDYLVFSDTLYHVASLSIECVERDTAT